MSERPPMGIHHLTVVPENASADATTDRESAIDSDEGEEPPSRGPQVSSD